MFGSGVPTMFGSGVPTMFGSGGEPEAFPVDRIVRESFGISLKGRAYTFEPLTSAARGRRVSRVYPKVTRSQPNWPATELLARGRAPFATSGVSTVARPRSFSRCRRRADTRATPNR
jgi:hypothetical protein